MSLTESFKVQRVDISNELILLLCQHSNFEKLEFISKGINIEKETVFQLTKVTFSMSTCAFSSFYKIHKHVPCSKSFRMQSRSSKRTNFQKIKPAKLRNRFKVCHLKSIFRRALRVQRVFEYCPGPNPSPRALRKPKPKSISPTVQLRKSKFDITRLPTNLLPSDQPTKR